VADRDSDVLIVGGGVAGASCAAALRERGFHGSILLVGRELDPPYERPPASKGLLRGELAHGDIHLHPESWWEEQGVQLLTRTSATKLDPGGRTATLSSRETVGFGQALLATGAMVRRVTVDGSELDGIHYLRAPGNAEAIRADVEGRERIVLVGGSYIGCEVAASLTAMGKGCTVLMQESEPMQRGFGPRVGAWVRELLEGHGVEVVGDDALHSYGGDDGRVQSVRCTSGRELEADVVVVGAGVVPDVMLARAAGLQLGETGGILCDRALRSSAGDIWAAGDVCEYDSVIHGRRLRVEHWEAAAAQGRHVAGAMLGGSEPFAEVPYFWCDLADWATMESVGPAARWDREIFHGTPGDPGGFSVWYLEGERLGAALSVGRGRGRELDAARRMIVSGERVDADALADPDGPPVDAAG